MFMQNASTMRSSNAASSARSAATSRAARKTSRRYVPSDVRLVHGGHLAASVPARVVERETHDPFGRRLRDRLDGDAGIGTDSARALFLAQRDQLAGALGALFELDARVQVFGVLADDDDIHAVVAPARPRNGQDGAQARVQTEFPAQRHVHAPESRAHRRGDGSLDGHLVPLDRFDGRSRQRRAVLLHEMRPRSATSQTISAPLASTTRCMAADVSGPMPSPGTRATVCDAMFSPSAIVRTMPLCAAFWADATNEPEGS